MFILKIKFTSRMQMYI